MSRFEKPPKQEYYPLAGKKRKKNIPFQVELDKPTKKQIVIQ